MEAVVAATVISQAAIHLLEVRQRRPRVPRTQPNDVPEAETERRTRIREGSSQEANGNAASDQAPGDQPDAANAHVSTEGEEPASREAAVRETCPVDISSSDVAKLRQKAAALREKARDMNAPDTFVAYARTIREAEALEARISVLNASQPAADGDILSGLQQMLMRRATPRGMRQAANSTGMVSFMSKRAILIVTQMLLGLYFYVRGDRVVLRMDCELLRPLAWLLARKEPAPCVDISGAGDFECPAAEICTISYYLFGMMFGAVVRRMITFFKAKK